MFALTSTGLVFILSPVYLRVHREDDTSGLTRVFQESYLAARLNSPFFREDGLPVYVFKYPSPEFYLLYQDEVKQPRQRYTR